MHPLARTRSQYFVSSPRKGATPLKHKPARHPSKRRRLESTSAFAPSRSINVSDTEEADDEPGPSRARITVLSSEAGQQAINRSESARRGRDLPRTSEGPQNGGIATRDVFDSTDEDRSPKKRKRGEGDDKRSGSSSSWVEMDDDEEEEPEFIAESDQHLLAEAPAYALHRLRKAELIRLWKVAGMWTSGDDDEEESIASLADDDDDGGLGKKELVDGLIAARKNATEGIEPSQTIHSPRNSPKRKAALEAAFEIKRLRSASSTHLASPSSCPSSDEDHPPRTDLDATPRAIPRTRSRIRIKGADNTLLKSGQRRAALSGSTGGRLKRSQARLFRSKSRDREERKARFDETVQSPAKNLATRPRRSSTLSSVYTTTDADSVDDPIAIRQTPRRSRRSLNGREKTPARRLRTSAKSNRIATSSRRSNEYEIIEIEDSTDDSDQDDANPTPLVHRLRSRTRSSLIPEQLSEVDADGEEEDEDGDGHSAASPVASRRLRSHDRLIDSNVSMRSSRRNFRALPGRGAKAKAIEALKGGDSDTESIHVDDMAVEESVDGDEATDQDMDDGPRSGPLTRSQLRAQADSSNTRSSRSSPQPSEDYVSESGETASLTPLSPESDGDDTTEVDEAEAEAVRLTRSGRAFGVWQSRKSRLRQEAIDDPDMEVDEDADDDEEDDESFEADVDLTDATLSSLIRLLRDELVQMCEARGLEVGGTKPQLAKLLLQWRDEQAGYARSTTSSQATARPKSPKTSKSSRPRIIRAVGSNVHQSGKTTPVLLRDHIHATDPATPPHSDESRPNGEAELNLDLSELGLEDSMIKPGQLLKLERIGSGGFKDVYVGKLRGRKVAISEFREHLSEMDIRELKLLAEFSHPNIVRFRGICIPEDNSQVPCMLVSELCENGDLFDYIRNVPCPPVERVLGLMLDIARGLEYLHTRKPAIIHRDCKSSNILINRQGQAKVGDFGLARVKHSTRSMIRSLVGTVNWQAPELWHPHPRYDYKVDVFSAGMVYWEMMSGWLGEKKYPWEGHNEHYIYDAVGAKHRRPAVVGLRKHWGSEPVNLMERMWHQDPGERPTMTDVVTDLEAIITECD